jgi:3-deoxy-7-phosphoheptulonate synthase
LLLRLRTPLGPDEFERILGLARELGYTTRFVDEGSGLLELKGSGDPSHRSRIADCSAVAQVLDASDCRELHQRDPERPGTVVSARDARFGGGWASLIGGPCAVEDPELLLEVARAVRDAGGTCLRGGAFKPRTSPYSFQGLGLSALDMLADAREETGLAIVTEVLDVRDVEAVDRVADVFQVGSRNMSNGALLRELGNTRKPVLLKRGLSATAREFLLAAEYLLAGGNDQVVLCERGIRGFDSATRNVLDVGTVAHLQGATHLPVIVDPSHAAGRADLVRPLARAGIAAGADGLIVEVHPRPVEASSDGEQAIDFATLAGIAEDARALLELFGRRLATPARASNELAAAGSDSTPRS